jgi:iron complex outermembrane receptor protein
MAFTQSSEPLYETNEVVVTATRLPTAVSQTTRSVKIITKEELHQLPVQKLQDVLAYIEGVQLSRRGPLGAQADVRMRGGSFEQTLILIDGNKVSDPQTGHHNLNLPVTMEDIEQVEILKGAGSRVYGPNAFGGVINIITKKQNSAANSLAISGGENGYYSATASLSLPISGTSQQLSFSKQASDGYRPNTDFQNYTLWYNLNSEFNKGDVSLKLGYMDKAFGANQFYSASFPDQWEQTKTTYLALGSRYSFGEAVHEHQLKANLHWRQNSDRFLLRRDDPEFYQNRHLTNVFGANLGYETQLAGMRSAIHLDGGLEDIESTNLGDRTRRFVGIIGESHLSWSGKLKVVPGVSVYAYSEWKPQVQPSLDILYQIHRDIQSYGSVSRAFRIPTYTELYYEDRVNLANPDLKPEEAWVYEIGLRWVKQNWRMNTSLFYRDGKNLIDWVKPEGKDLWQALNISDVNTFGLETTLGWQRHATGVFGVNSVELGYSFLNSGRDLNGLDSRYVFQYLKHQAKVTINQTWTGNINQLWALRVQEPKGISGYMLLDTRLQYRATIGNVATSFYAEITNVFNKTYIEVEPIVMPGRWIILGIKSTF